MSSRIQRKTPKTAEKRCLLPFSSGWPIFGLRALPLVAGFALAGPVLAQSGAPLTLSTTCLGEHRTLELSPIKGGFLDLNGQIFSFAFGDRLTVCVEPGAVTVTEDDAPTTFPCTAIRDSPDEGMGYQFDADGASYGLWFFIAKGRDPQVLEIGLSRGTTELVWIDTNATICAD